MEVGQLFFSLGFKSEGTAAAEKFETVTSTLAQTSTELLNIFERINNTLEKVAMKMGAVTQEELDLFKQNQKTSASMQQLGEEFKEFAEEQSKQGNQSKKSAGLYQMFVDKLDGSIGKLNRVKVQVMAVASSMVYLTKRSSDYAASLTRFTNLTGLSAQKLQVFQRQAALSGIGAEEVTSAVQELQQAAVDIQLGKGNTSTWSLLGIKPGVDPFQQIESIKKAMGNMSAPLYTNLARSAGLSDELISFLREIKDIPPPDKNMILSEDEISELKAFNIMFNKALEGFKVGLIKIGQLLIPVTRPLVQAFDRLGWAMRNLSDWMNKWGTATKAIFTFIGVALSVLMVKLWPVQAAFVAILILLDDFITFMQGGDSLIGRFFKLIPTILEAIKVQIGSFIDWVSEKFKNFSAMKTLIEMVKAINPLLGGLGGYIYDKFSGGAPGGTPMAPSAAMNQNNAQTVTNNIQITVPGSTDPEAFAKQLGDALKRQNTDGYFQNGASGR